MPTFPRSEMMTLTSEVAHYDLAESIGPDLRLRELVGLASEELGELPLGYVSVQGDVQLRTAIAERHGVEADDVVLTVGAMQALSLIAFILCGDGEELVTTSPYFPVARTAFDAVGASVRTLPLAFEDSYRLDPHRLDECLSPETRLVCLVTPQNPSGVAFPSATITRVLDSIRELCPDAYLLLDETYREAAYGEEPVTPSIVGSDPRVISCASLSKCHGAPGLRLGWAITRDAFMRDQILYGKFHSILSCSAIDEALALKALQQSDAIIAERRQRLAGGLARTAAWIAAHDALTEWVRPDAGALCCIRLKEDRFDAEATERFYAGCAKRGLRVASGTWFGESRRVFRLGFGLLDLAMLDEALQALSDAVREAAASDLTRARP